MEIEQNNGVNTPVLSVLKAEFTDDAHWQELCEKTRYVLPALDVLPTVVNIRLWLNRLEIKEADYRDAMQTSIADMIAMNPTWPLRSLAGLLLEYRFTK